MDNIITDNNAMDSEAVDMEDELDEAEESREIYISSEHPSVRLNRAELVNIHWERINLYMNVKVNLEKPLPEGGKLEFFAVNRYGRAHARMLVTDINDDIYTLFLNVTNAGDNRAFPAGTYYIAVCCDETLLGYCYCSKDAFSKLKDFSRSFLYRNRSYCYIAEFFVNDPVAGKEQPLSFLTMASSAIKVGSSVETSSQSLENLMI